MLVLSVCESPLIKNQDYLQLFTEFQPCLNPAQGTGEHEIEQVGPVPELMTEHLDKENAR